MTSPFAFRSLSFFVYLYELKSTIFIIFFYVCSGFLGLYGYKDSFIKYLSTTLLNLMFVEQASASSVLSYIIVELKTLGFFVLLLNIYNIYLYMLYISKPLHSEATYKRKRPLFYAALLYPFMLFMFYEQLVSLFFSPMLNLAVGKDLLPKIVLEIDIVNLLFNLTFFCFLLYLLGNLFLILYVTLSKQLSTRASHCRVILFVIIGVCLCLWIPAIPAFHACFIITNVIGLEALILALFVGQSRIFFDKTNNA